MPLQGLEHIRAIAERVAQSHGLEVWDLVSRREAQGHVVRIFIDRPGPAATPEESVSIEDCEQVNREIGTILDVEDPLPFAYTLEVSSPGLTRPLRGENDYRRFAGRLAKLVVSEAGFNQETGQVDLFAIKHIVRDVEDPATQISLKEAQDLYGEEAEVDMEIEFPKRTDVLGRIAAQTAKQVIFQKVREAERENIFAEYNQRVGEVVHGAVKRFENGDIILEIGRIEAALPRKEQSRAESYSPGDRIRTVIKGVNRSAKGPQIILSRTDPALLIKLFEQEVPEIYEGTVNIRGAVREAGDRAKVAVYSRERDVDPGGACVGMKGTRVQSSIRELRGEKIDIVEFSDDPIAFVTNALSPAKVQRVPIVDDGGRVMEVIVEDKQL